MSLATRYSMGCVKSVNVKLLKNSSKRCKSTWFKAGYIYTYRFSLEGLRNNRQTTAALSLFQGMGDSKFCYDVTLYTILINATIKDGNLDTARDLFKCLWSKGPEPDVKLYSTKINVLVQEMLLEEDVTYENNGCLPKCCHIQCYSSRLKWNMREECVVLIKDSLQVAPN